MKKREDETDMVIVKKPPRNKWIAGLISLFLPGVGQIYNRHYKKGFIIIALCLTASIVPLFVHPFSILSDSVFLSNFQIPKSLLLNFDLLFGAFFVIIMIASSVEAFRTANHSSFGR